MLFQQNPSEGDREALMHGFVVPFAVKKGTHSAIAPALLSIVCS
jgi:hypothetical protein